MPGFERDARRRAPSPPAATRGNARSRTRARARGRAAARCARRAAGWPLPAVIEREAPESDQAGEFEMVVVDGFDQRAHLLQMGDAICAHRRTRQAPPRAQGGTATSKYGQPTSIAMRSAVRSCCSARIRSLRSIASQAWKWWYRQRLNRPAPATRASSCFAKPAAASRSCRRARRRRRRRAAGRSRYARRSLRAISSPSCAAAQAGFALRGEHVVHGLDVLQGEQRERRHAGRRRDAAHASISASALP